MAGCGRPRSSSVMARAGTWPSTTGACSVAMAPAPGTPDWVHDEETVFEWLASAVAEFGERHEVTQMPLGAYVGREPLSELREMAPHAEIITVQLDEDGTR